MPTPHNPQNDIQIQKFARRKSHSTKSKMFRTRRSHETRYTLRPRHYNDIHGRKDIGGRTDPNSSGQNIGSRALWHNIFIPPRKIHARKEILYQTGRKDIGGRIDPNSSGQIWAVEHFGITSACLHEKRIPEMRFYIKQHPIFVCGIED